MSISVNSNLLSLNVQNSYNKNVVGLQSSMDKLSSMQKINYAGDDPAGIGISERLRTRIQSIDKANQNLQNDSAILKIADGALSNMADIVSSIREKIVQAADDSTTDDARVRLGKDIDNLISRYDDVMKDAKYGSRAFFDKTDSTGIQKKNFAVQHGADAADNFELTFSALDAASLGIASSAVGSGVIKTGAVASDIKALITTVDSALASIYNEQSTIGSYEQRLGYLSDNKTAEATALRELESGIRDLDPAKGMTDFMKYNIRTQASQYMLAQAGQVPAMVLQLLQP